MEFPPGLGRWTFAAEHSCFCSQIDVHKPYHPWDCYIYLHENPSKSTIQVGKYTIVPWMVGGRGKGMVNIGNHEFSSLACFLENCWMKMTGSKLIQMWLLAATKLHCQDLRGPRLMKHGTLNDTSRHASLRWCIVPKQPNSKLHLQFWDVFHHCFDYLNIV